MDGLSSPIGISVYSNVPYIRDQLDRVNVLFQIDLNDLHLFLVHGAVQEQLALGTRELVISAKLERPMSADAVDRRYVPTVLVRQRERGRHDEQLSSLKRQRAGRFREAGVVADLNAQFDEVNGDDR
jgi:hypothetical protein